MFTIITKQVFTRLYKTLQDLQDPLLSRLHSGRPWWTWWTWDWAHWAWWALFWSQPLDAPWRDAREIHGRDCSALNHFHPFSILIHCDPFWTYFEHILIWAVFRFPTDLNPCCSRSLCRSPWKFPKVHMAIRMVPATGAHLGTRVPAALSWKTLFKFVKHIQWNNSTYFS